MGAEPYEYTVPYVADVQAALDQLRQQVFESGQYHPAEMNPSSPQQALEMAEECGTRSILDILAVSESPDFCCAAPFTSEELLAYFGTDRPTQQQVADSDLYWDELERGMARYAIPYQEDRPRYIYFVGYSFD